ncbi:MAG: PIN domain-containing protein [Treponema sp.]|nr:PIN domain-containing protein [Treponema sp.]
MDTNIVLDVLMKRDPFYEDSTIILYLAKALEITALIASISICNIFYILRRSGKNLDDTYQEINKLSSIFSVVPVSDTTITKAITLRWNDYEDAVQFIAASENKAEYIITRNKEDYRNSDIPCMTPTEFIAFLKEKEQTD